MKILWFTNTSSKYDETKHPYNGGGWIESLEQIVKDEKNIELAVSFFHSDEYFKVTKGKTTYYPISIYNSTIKKIKHNLFYKKYDNLEINYFLKVIEDFKPDVIHVFGTENSFGLITRYTNIPVVIHLQGILNPCLNAYFPPGSNMLEIIKQNFFNPIILFKTLRNFYFFKHNANREIEILKNCYYFMGRTGWDHDVSKLYSSKSKYFYCSEVLRNLFYDTVPWEYKSKDIIILVSTISKANYKGFDLILKTAKLLKEEAKINFEWKVFGINDYKEWEINLGIKCDSVNINFMGIADSNTLVKHLLNADAFVHPSYIDNSPNSICEAQLLGVPVVSTNVGGISTLIHDKFTGYLIPSNDPFALVSSIIEIKNYPKETKLISENGRKIALKRHNKDTIKNDLFNCYLELKDAKSNYSNI